jgi:Rad3-related DNA helicase
MEDQLPRAVIRFRQGVGRLIRSQTDKGLVAVLDPRIVTKSYGRLFLAALPEGVEVVAMEVGDYAGGGDEYLD